VKVLSGAAVSKCCLQVTLDRLPLCLRNAVVYSNQELRKFLSVSIILKLGVGKRFVKFDLAEDMVL
jgi:hypothetical protein